MTGTVWHIVVEKQAKNADVIVECSAFRTYKPKAYIEKNIDSTYSPEFCVTLVYNMVAIL